MKAGWRDAPLTLRDIAVSNMDIILFAFLLPVKESKLVYDHQIYFIYVLFIYIPLIYSYSIT